MDNLDSFKKAIKQAGYDENEAQSYLDIIKEMRGPSPSGTTENATTSGTTNGRTFGTNFVASANNPNAVVPSNQMASYNYVMPEKFGITQAYGNPNRMYASGYHQGTDYGTPENTPLAAPPGSTWEVEHAFSGAGPGSLNDNTNGGYGNSVVLKNTATGERIRFSHLNEVNVKPGEIVQGGTQFGKTGSTGRSSGPHVDVEAYDASGKLVDVKSTKFGNYF